MLKSCTQIFGRFLEDRGPGAVPDFHISIFLPENPCTYSKVPAQFLQITANYQKKMSFRELSGKKTGIAGIGHLFL